MADGLQGLGDIPLLQFDNMRLGAHTFLHRVGHFAAFLHSIGVARGNVVTLCAPNIPMAVAAFYAISYLGAVVGVVHPMSPAQAVTQQMQTTHSRWLVCWDRLCARNADDWVGVEHIVPLSAAAWLDLPHRLWRRISMGAGALHGANIHRYHARAAYPPCAEHSADGDAVALYLPSGGTMGMPKTIVVHNAMLNAAAYATVQLGRPLVAGQDAMLMLLPIFHGFGVGVCMHSALSCGVRLVLVPYFRPKALATLLLRAAVTYMAAVPGVYAKLLATGRLHRGLSLVAAYCGGDVLPPAIKARWDDAMRALDCPCRLYQGYGLAETVAVCCANSPDADRAGSIGRPVWGTSLCVCDEAGHVLPAGSVGELCVSGPLVMRGYLDDTPDGVLVRQGDAVWLHTGDLGYCDGDGYFFFTGRKKRISVIGGVNVYHQQLEALALSVPAVQAAAAIECRAQGKPYVRLYLVATPDGADAVKALFATHLTRYAIPRQIRLVSHIPLTPLGKVDYAALQGQD